MADSDERMIDWVWSDATPHGRDEELAQGGSQNLCY